MIRIPLINRVLKPNTINAKADKKLIAKIKALSESPEWQAQLDKRKREGMV
jgi:tripartite-type tricarboxylate transporter receptor subunit TctC